jgi:hypothetical protein
LRLISRLRVDGARFNDAEIERSDRPVTTPREISSRSAIALAWTALFSAVVSHPTSEECWLPNYGYGQRAVRSFPENRLSASDPTSALCLFRCNESSFGTSSSATSSSLRLETRCCIDRLKPQSISEYLTLDATCSGVEQKAANRWLRLLCLVDHSDLGI